MIADKKSDFYIGCVRMRKPTNFDLSPAPHASSYLRRLIMDTHSDTDSDRDSTDEFTGSTSGGEGTSLSQDSVPSCSKQARYACSFHPGESNPFDWATASKKGPYYAYCTLCSRNVSVAYGGLKDLKKHEQTGVHQSASKSVRGSGSITTYFSQKPSPNEKVL